MGARAVWLPCSIVHSFAPSVKLEFMQVCVDGLLRLLLPPATANHHFTAWRWGPWVWCLRSEPGGPGLLGICGGGMVANARCVVCGTRLRGWVPKQKLMHIPDAHLPRFVATYGTVFVGGPPDSLATAVVDCRASKDALARLRAAALELEREQE